MKKRAVVVLAAVVAAACGSNGDDSSGDREAAIAVVVSALDAKNEFDLDGWLAVHEGGTRKGIPLFAEELLMNANQHWEVTEPCRVTGENTAGDTVVECLITNTDDFWGAGEIYEPRDLRFTVRSDGLITTDDLIMESNSFASAERDAFNRSFYAWIKQAFPDVHSELDPGIRTFSAPGFETQDPDHMLLAIDYVDEFVAQSADYPPGDVPE